MTDYKRRTFTEWLIGAERQPIEPVKRSDPNGTPPPTPESLRAFQKKNISLNDSLSISAVYAAVNIIVNWTSQLSLSVYKNGEELPVPSIIAQPDTESTQYAFIKQTVTSLALTGNAYWKVTRRRSDAAALSLEVLNPLSMVVEQVDGKKVYKYTGYTVPREFTAREIVHVMTFEVPGRLTGLAPLEAGGASFAGVLALRKYADEWFGEGGAVRQHFTYRYTMDEDAQINWMKAIQSQKASNNGDIFTTEDTSVENLSLSPAEALYLEQQTFNITDVARWFGGIPPMLMLASVDGNSMTYSNLQTDSRLFVTNVLMGYMRPIEVALSGLLPRGQEVKFNTEALLRADTQERYDAYESAITAGFMTVNEVRAKEGLPPINEKETPPETPEAA